MSGRPTPHDFLLFLRTHCPSLARRFDGILGLERSEETLVVRVPGGSWWEGELKARLGLLGLMAGSFFGGETVVVLAPRPAASADLPFPVVQTKTWNHVAFWARGAEEDAVVAVRKPRYAERWLPLTDAPEGRIAEELAAPEVFVRRYRAPSALAVGDAASAWLLPEVLADLCRLAREAASYAQLVLPFPGDEEADRLEGRLCAVKEWGVPGVPAPILQKYVGRLHYLAPGTRAIGVRAAEFARGVTQAVG